MADNESILRREDCINLKEGLARVRDNKKLYRRMLGMFLESGEFAAMEESLMEKDYGKAADAAHALKGMTGNLSLTALFNISTKMMEELRQGVASDESYAALKSAYSQTRAYAEEIMQELEGE